MIDVELRRQSLQLGALVLVGLGIMLMPLGVLILVDAMTVPGHGFGILMVPGLFVGGPLIVLLGIAAFRGHTWAYLVGAGVLFLAGGYLALFGVVALTFVSLVLGIVGLIGLWASFVLFRGWRRRKTP